MEVRMSKINLSPEAKRRLQNERRRMSREAGKQAEREFENALLAIHNSANTHKRAGEHVAQVALIRNLLSLCRAVNASFGVAVPVRIDAKEVGRRNPKWTPEEWLSAQYENVGVSGRTDMTQIDVTYPLWRTAEEGVPLYTVDTQHLVDLISDIKALQYHELGHILFTLPIRTLTDGLTDEWVAKRPELGFADAYAVRVQTGAIMRAWNILEDQRMETALVHESPYIARYLTKLILRYMIKSEWISEGTQRHDERGEAFQYFLVVNRRYLPLSVRSKARSLAIAELTEPVVVEAEQIIREYCSANNEDGILTAALKFYRLLNNLGVVAPTMDSHPSWGKPKYAPWESADSTQEQAQDQLMVTVPAEDSEGKDKQVSKSKKATESEKSDDSAPDGNSNGNSKDDGSKDESESTGSGDEDEDEDEDEESDDESDESDKAGDSGSDETGDDSDTDAGGAGIGNDESDQTKSTSVDEAIKDALGDVSKELSQDADIEETIRSINADLNKDGTMLLEPEQGKGGTVTGEALAQAEEVASRLARSFDSAVSSAQPVWEEGHRTGAVNAFRYRTRTAGDHNYRRTLSSEGNTGLDIAVSLMLDISGSMHDYEDRLSQSAYAVKLACDQVGIACTVTTFNSHSFELYRREDTNVVPLALNTGGGTNPTGALRVLDSQREGEKYHLVIVLTDGQWHHAVLPEVQKQFRDGRVFLGVSLGDEYLNEMELHSTVTIKTIEDLPEVVRNFLLIFLG